MKRLFTALRFPDQTLNEIFDVQEKFKDIDDKAKYTLKENFHITLYFIGNVEDDKVHLLENALKKACSIYRDEINEPITLSFNRVGTFGNGRVVWLGIEENESLKKLSYIIRDQVEEAGIPVVKKPFRAHITIARKYKAELPEISDFPEAITIDQAALVWSHRVDDKLTYTNLLFDEISDKEV